MKTNYIFIILSFAFITWSLDSCKKDTPYNYQSTPFNANLPDSILKKYGPMHIHNNNNTTIEGIELGRKLFYDTRLSGNNDVACANCHQQQFAFGDQEKQSKGVLGALTGRNSPTIFNMGWGMTFFWDGRRNSLEKQAHDPVSNPNEMNGNWKDIPKRLQTDPFYPVMFYRAFGTGIIDSELIVNAIAQFERSLLSFNSKFDQFYYTNDSSLLNTAELRGYEIYLHKGTCNACHTLPLGQMMDFYANVGLEKGISDSGLAKTTGLASDIGKFKTPSTRNLAYTAPYMHNGNFKTIREVLNFYNNDINGNTPNIDAHLRPLFTHKGSLTASEINDLEIFLNTLNDPTFIKNSKFSNPN